MSNPRNNQLVLCGDGKYRTKEEIDIYILENVYDKMLYDDEENLNGRV